MNRGDIYWYYGPVTVTEQVKKKRPVIIVSSDAANQNTVYPYLSVVPITSNIEHIFALELDLADTLSKPSKAQPQQIFTCRKDHLSSKKVAALSWDLKIDLEEKLKKYLALS